MLSGAAPFGFFVSQLIGGSNSLTLESTRSNNAVWRAALPNPNLVALSGDTASFLAGGQFPVPQAGSLGAISFTYQPYGVGLSFTPTVLGNGLIDLVIKPEVSEIDTNHTVTVAGTSGARTDRAQSLDHARTARRPKLHARRPVAELQHQRAGPAALDRRRAGARRAVPLQPSIRRTKPIWSSS